MKITDFAVKVSRLEKGKKEVNVAQIAEILKIVDGLTCGILYKVVRLLPILMICLLCGISQPAEANVWDGVVNYVKAGETETGVYYNFDDQRTHGYVGRTVVQDVVIKNVDLSCVWNLKDSIGAEASYTIKDGAVAPYVGVIVGTNRIEKLNNSDLGEAFIAISGGIKF